MTSRRRSHNHGGLETTCTVVVTICFLPCICIIGSGIVATEIFKAIKNYERPKTKIRKREERKQKEIWRTTPRPLEPRLELHLTIGREVIVGKDKEETQEGKEEKCLQSRGSFFRIGNKNKAREEPKSEPAKLDLSSLVDLSENDSHTMTYPAQRKTELVKSRNIAAGKTDDQFESYLFKLPFEVRRQIWEETLGGYVFHIYFVQAYRRMSHTRCKTRAPTICQNDDPISGPCRQLFKVPGAPDKWGHSNILSILQSCRRIYSETITTLYTKNTFDFESLSDVLRLSQTILPDRMRLIKDVQWKRVNSDGDPRPMQTFEFYRTCTPWLTCIAPRPCRCIAHWRPGEPPGY